MVDRTASEVRRAVMDATDAQILATFGSIGDAYFNCARCSSPGGAVLVGLWWDCRRCGRTGTRFELERRILEDRYLMRRFFDRIKHGAIV